MPTPERPGEVANAADIRAPDYIVLDGCVERGVYAVDARNLRVAVYDGVEGFIGIRTKFGGRYLSTEYHWDRGSPFGTVRPRRLLSLLPDDIELREREPTTCDRCGELVAFRRDRPGGTGTWHHLEVGACAAVMPVGHVYRPLFEFLERCEQRPLDPA